MKAAIPKKIFNLLYQKIIIKCQSDPAFDPLGKGEGLFGFGKTDKQGNPGTIKAVMMKDTGVQALAKTLKTGTINGKYLYERMREMEDISITTITITPFYQKLYVNFIGFTTWNSFLYSLLKEGLITQEEKSKADLLQNSAVDNQLSPVIYHGFYFSLQTRAVKSFFLQFSKNHLQAHLWGFHDSPTQIGSDGTPYVGKITTSQNNLRLELTSKTNPKNKITLILNIGSKSFQDHDYVRGLYLTISSKGEPLSGEVIFINEEKSEFSQKKLFAEKYLNLQQHSIKTENTFVDGLDNIKVKHHDINQLANLQGYYTGLSFQHFDEEDQTKCKLYLSTFYIADNYRSKLHSAYSHNDTATSIKLHCSIWLTEGQNQKKFASVLAYTQDLFIVKNHALIEIPDIAGKKYVKGVFSSIGHKNRELLASAVLFKRISNIEEWGKIVPRSFKGVSIGEPISNFTVDDEYFNELRKHHIQTTIRARP